MNVHKSARTDEFGASVVGSVELDSFLAKNPQVQYVDCVFCDMCGTIRGKRVPRSEMEKVFRSGLQIPYTIYFLDARGDMADPLGRGYGDGDPDGTAWPVPGTLTTVNWSNRPHAQVLMTLADGRGQPYFAEPRNVLKRIAERFSELELNPVVAVELEFYLIDRQRSKLGLPQQPIAPDTGQRESAPSVYGISDLDRYADILTGIAEAAATQRIPATAASSEAAPGQFEINLKHVPDAARAGDHAVFLRQIVRAIARQNDLDATFMAKPYLGSSGSGMHIHVSLLHRSGRNVFDDGTPRGSELMRFAIGGLQAVMAESMALFAPNVNSYRRFVPNAFVPRNKRWGFNNRSTSIRVPAGAAEARRVEHRVAGADANPYLVLAAVLAGIHHGLSHRIDPGPPFEGNASTFVDETIPFNIDAALLALENGSIMREYLGRSYIDLYCATKRVELDRVRNHIPAHEFDWYL
jgi:glutamine synthetase